MLFLFHLFHIFVGNKPAGLYHEKISILCLFDPDLGLHKTMFIAKGSAVIVFAIWSEPLDLPADILFAYVAFGAHDIHIFQDVFFVKKLSGYVLGIGIKYNPDLLLLGLWGHIGVKRDLGKGLFSKGPEDLGSVLSICQSPVEWNVLRDPDLIYRCLQRFS